MSKLYPPKHEILYNKLSATTGMSREEIDIFILKMIKIFINDLHRYGKVCVPYLGRFILERKGPRKRSVTNFATGIVSIIDVPARDKLTFKINPNYSKLFR